MEIVFRKLMLMGSTGFDIVGLAHVKVGFIPLFENIVPPNGVKLSKMSISISVLYSVTTWNPF